LYLDHTLLCLAEPVLRLEPELLLFIPPPPSDFPLFFEVGVFSDAPVMPLIASVTVSMA
jgi:hypothetical protein